MASMRKPGRIGLSCWSMRYRIWVEPASARFPQADFPREAKRAFGLDTVELYNNFLASTDDAYLDGIVKQAEEEGVCLHGMAVDVRHGNMCAADEAERKIAVAQNMIWIPVARRLGLAYFRANTGGTNPPAAGEMERAIRSYRELTDVAWNYGIRIAIEDHGGISYTVAAIKQLIEAVGKDRMCTLPDIGNFSDAGAYDKIAVMAPYAVAAHAKLFDFGPDGEAGNISLKRMVAVLSAAGFRGPWSIETGDPDAKAADDAIRKSKALLEKHLA